jgi:hypothetical protein
MKTFKFGFLYFFLFFYAEHICAVAERVGREENMPLLDREL